MQGLTVRWSLTGAPEGVEDALRAYVEATSYSRYAGRKDLRFKTRRMRDGAWYFSERKLIVDKMESRTSVAP